MQQKTEVIIIGAGASGLMAALSAAENGAGVLVLEHMPSAGQKLLLTGNGRCNFTNACSMDEFMRHVPRNSRFLYSALSFFSPDGMMDFLKNAGCPVKVERGRRAFPQSDKASDVTKALCGEMRRLGVRLCLNTEVGGIVTGETEGTETVRGVRLKDGTFLPFDSVIIATGGLSYPSTGSTGDGYRFAGETGHRVTDLSPSLTGIETKEAWPALLQGLSLRNVRITVTDKQKKLMTETGEMLFTHYGISGPLILEASSVISGRALDSVTISLDLKPAVDAPSLNDDVIRLLRLSGAKTLENALSPLFPRRMTGPFLEQCGIDPGMTASQLSSASRAAIVSALKKLILTPVSLRPYAEAIITRGGVDIRQIDPSTMASRLTEGLYFAGEVLDVDAFTGGYNLQIAFSTGALAGKSAALRTTKQI